MKKIITLLLALVMCVGLAVPALASENTHLYAYSCEVSGQEEYAAAKLSSFFKHMDMIMTLQVSFWEKVS